MGTMGRRTPRLKLSADELDSVVGSWVRSPNVDADPQQHSDGLPTPNALAREGTPASSRFHVARASDLPDRSGHYHG